MTHHSLDHQPVCFLAEPVTSVALVDTVSRWLTPGVGQSARTGETNLVQLASMPVALWSA